MQNDSGSNVYRLVGVRDRVPTPPGTPQHAMPLSGPRGFLDVHSTTHRRKDGGGKHTIQWRSLLRRPLKVDARMSMDGAHYVETPPLDEVSPDGTEWEHNGDSPGGTKRWTRVEALYVRDHGSQLPSVRVDIEVSSAFPMENVTRSSRTFTVQ